MTKNEARRRGRIMLAYADGTHRIRWKKSGLSLDWNVYDPKSDPCNHRSLTLDFDRYKYELLPPVQYRPLNTHELLNELGSKVSNGDFSYELTAINMDGNVCLRDDLDNTKWRTPQQLLDNFTWAENGLPVGVES